MAEDASNLRVVALADNDHEVALVTQPPGNPLDFEHIRTGGVDRPDSPSAALLENLGWAPVRPDDQRSLADLSHPPHLADTRLLELLEYQRIVYQLT